jgi:serine/threonine protein kinase
MRPSRKKGVAVKFINGKMYPKYKDLLQRPKLITEEGEEYTAYCPKNYKVLGFKAVGAQYYVSEIEDSHNKVWILKNIKPNKNPDDADGVLAWKTVVCVNDIALKKFYGRTGVRVPAIHSAWHSDDGSNYIIEEKKYGIHLTQTVINALPSAEKKMLVRWLASFLAEVHSIYMPTDVLDAKKIKRETEYPQKDDYFKTKQVYYNCSIGRQTSIVHSDLKPENILYDADGICVIDWASARLSASSLEFVTMYNNKEYSDQFMDDLMDTYMRVFDIMHGGRYESFACNGATALAR